MPAPVPATAPCAIVHNGRRPFVDWCDEKLREARAPDGDAAIAAAQSASIAAGELLRFAREGELSSGFAFAFNTIEHLADALKLAIEIEQPRIASGQNEDVEGVELLGQLSSALTRFLEGWA